MPEGVGNRPRILVVEDDEPNRKLLAAVYGRHGMDVIQCEDAERGIEAARTQKPTLIVMDIRLPGIDGVQAARILKEDARTAAIPILCLSAYGYREERACSGTQMFAGSLTKPVDLQVLLDTTRAIIARGPAADTRD